MKSILTEWRVFLAEIKDDPSYNQETYNAFLLLAISNERGGNRDEVKNDIRAVEEVLTVSPVEAIQGGIQKNMGDYILSTMKLRIRLPAAGERELLTQEIVNVVNRMRGITVRRHSSEKATELREDEMNYSGVLPKDPAVHRRMKTRLIKHGGQPNTPPFSEKPSYEKPKPTSEGQLDEDSE